MENFNQPAPQFGEGGLFKHLEVNEQGKLYLDEASKWAKFLGIIGFIFLFFMLIGGFGVMMAGSAAFRNSGIPFSGAFIGLLYIAFAALYFFPAFYLYKFGTIARRALQNESLTELNEGLRYLKSFFKFAGILTIVVIAFYIIAVLSVGMGAMTSRF
ncbi:DUF5362 family protein [Niabella beijingensis]|uniref:DUF5362 family protein n=1 Tax=Niabella beijingensis TaxID=2872700 RepID=UPI001CC14EE9|nr:DUF5362 family protein [Niabella beijingensis]MBZ4188797.1 DUF5362 family protein [Niabella beijingensis]